MELCFFLPFEISLGGVLLFLTLLLVVFVGTHLRSVFIWVLIIAVLVLLVVYDLFFWIPLIGLALFVWGYMIHYLKKFIQICCGKHKDKRL